MPPAPLPRSRPAARRRASPSRLLHPPSSFAASLCRFWHGIFNGKKYSVSFYSRQARAALEEEVEDCIGRRLRLGQPVEADRLARLWELMQAYIVSQNEAIELGLRASAPKLPNDTMNSFLHLLYAGEKPNSFWRKFSRRHHLHSAPPSSFWDYFEDFQARRMDVAGWLAANARGKILDIGSGAHSYIEVDAAADISAKALAENMGAKRKIKIRPLDKLASSTWPFPPGSFDTIMLNSVLSYVKNRARLMRLIHSTIAPGGSLLITSAPIQPHHPAFFFVVSEVKAGELARELKKAGFEAKDESTGLLVRIIARRA